MRLGCCIHFSGSDEDLARVEQLAGLGYQYIEPRVDCLQLASEPSAYYAVRRAFNRAALAPEVFSWTRTASGAPLIGDEVNWHDVEKHLARALDRMEEVGATTLAAGREAALELPDEYPVEDALHQLRYFLNMAADYAASLDIALGCVFSGNVEGYHSLGDAVAFVRQLGRPEVRLLLDMSVAAAEADGQNLANAPDSSSHVHCPVAEDGQLRLHPVILGALKASNHTGRISLVFESRGAEEMAGSAIDRLREALA